MSLPISDDMIKKAVIIEEQFRIEIAIHLFSLNIFTLGQATEFAKLYQMQMMEELAKRKIPLHYTVEDLDYDYQNIVKERDADYK